MKSRIGLQRKKDGYLTNLERKVEQDLSEKKMGVEGKVDQDLRKKKKKNSPPLVHR